MFFFLEVEPIEKWYSLPAKMPQSTSRNLFLKVQKNVDGHYTLNFMMNVFHLTVCWFCNNVGKE